LTEIYERYNAKGNLTFIGDEFVKLRTLRELNVLSLAIRIYQNNVLQATGELILDGTTNWDQYQYQLSIEIIDDYTEILRNIETKIDIIYGVGVWPEKYQVSGYEDDLTTIQDYENCFELKSLITAIVTTADNTLQFDISGTATDSFYYLKTWENPNYPGELPFNAIFLTTVRNVILQTGVTRGIITVQILFDYLKNFLGLFWEIEDRGGTPYFMQRHYSEVNKVIGSNPDLTNYLGANWTARKNKESFAEDRLYKRIVRELTASSQDHIGTDVIFPFINSEKILKIENDSFFTDIWDAQNNPENYPESDAEKFFILATDNNLLEERFLSWNNGEYEGSGSTDHTKDFNTFTWFLETLTIVDGTATDKYVYTNLIAYIDGGNLIPSGTIININLDYVITGGDLRCSLYGYNYTVKVEIDAFNINVGAPASGNLDHDFSALLINYNEVWIEIYEDAGSTNATITNTSIRYYQNVYRIKNGEFSSTDVANADLSLANTDTYQLSAIPHQIATVNSEMKFFPLNRLLPLRESFEIDCPVNDVKSDWDFTELINTELGEMEINSIERPFDSGFGKIKGNYKYLPLDYYDEDNNVLVQWTDYDTVLENSVNDISI